MDSIIFMNSVIGWLPTNSCVSLMTILGTPVTLCLLESSMKVCASIISPSIFLLSIASLWAFSTAPGNVGKIG